VLLVSFNHYGMFAEYLSPFVDLKGDIPEQGDAPESFWYPEEKQLRIHDWDEWIRQSESALYEVESLMDALDADALRVCCKCEMPYDSRDNEGIPAYSQDADRECISCWTGTGPLDFPGTYPVAEAAKKVGRLINSRPAGQKLSAWIAPGMTLPKIFC
jgi:hypothetical protein